MKIVVIDFKIEKYVCTPFLDRKKFKEWLSSWFPNEESEIYFVCVEDKTWKKWKTKDAKRVELKLDELMKLIEESDWLFLVNKNHAKACMYYPKDD